MFGLDKTKELADKVQAASEGQTIDSQLGTNNVFTPVEQGIEEFNKGTEFGHPHQNYYINEGMGSKIKKKLFGKKMKSGTYRPETTDEDVETPAFIKPEVEQRRKEESEKGAKEDAAHDALLKHSRKVGLEPMTYRRLLYVKKKHPDKLKAYKKEQRLNWVNDEDLLDAEELLKKY